MLENLLVVAVVVIILWVLILVVFLTISRKQPDVQAEMKNLDEQLSRAEQDSKPR
jgi:cell division protein FtsL